ncbi:carbohydrate ABC transporter permease [uncultured Paenibacillus sp.]|uniref:carbohydrate ABC transporter permease n=1 Tax=uncultured Paenibacillus sp. TaxID=227322 RepID=UPI0015AF3750|nr:sugar ABC transporter permease [uncultured Paenibacillus sp.]
MKKSSFVWTNYLYLLPAVLLVAVFFVTSIVYTLRLSFYEYDGFSAMRFVGMENYRYLFQDANFKISFMNTVIWVVFSLLFTLALPLLLAILITNSFWVGGFKNIFYYPTALSGTIGGIIMVAILSKYGIPQLFGLLGFEGLVRDWLAIPYVNTFIMILMGTWQGVGLNTILFITGLTTIPDSPIEAAKMEGARTIQLYNKVILPLLKPTTVVVLLMSLVNSFKVFDSIWVMTKGGPYRTSETLALTMYQESFIHGKFGVGAAVAVVLTMIILIVSYFNIRNTFGDTDRTA